MKKIAGIDGSKGGWVCVSGYENNYKELKFEKLKEFNDICDECKNEHESVSQNLILTGFKICKSCRLSKTIFPI